MWLTVGSIVILLFDVASVHIQVRPKGLEPQYNKHVPRGKWQLENLCFHLGNRERQGKPYHGNLNHRQYPCRSEVWIPTTSVDREVNVRWSWISDPSDWHKLKSHLEESISIQIHSSCKKSLIVGLISMPERMSCDRKNVHLRTDAILSISCWFLEWHFFWILTRYSLCC